MESTKAINALPSGSSRDLYSAHPSFSKVMAQHSDHLLGIIQNVLESQSIKGNIVLRDKEEKFEILQECNDTMLERINSNLDEVAGIRKKTPDVLVTEVKSSPLPQKYGLSTTWLNPSIASRTPAKLITAKNIIRPQVNFKTPVDNSNNPFVPRLKEKPNSIKPLAIMPEYDDDMNILSYVHPYELEIEKFEPTDEMLKEKQPQVPTDISGVSYIFVQTEAQLMEMVGHLREEKLIAVDLEHHSYRTFQGITCLMQISSRTKDFIIDTIELREDLHVLNEVFTRPTIVKIFHGADCDVEWLQRDLSLYLVNLFDTHQAAKRLGFARLGLAFLLKHYCNIDADKTFQLADWRIRPLPEQLMKYAQQDTHYLLYIYDRMTNDLLKAANGQTNLVRSVFMDSKIICLKRYNKPNMSCSYRELYVRSKRSFDNRQQFALREIFAWRDKIAREEDESYPYVLPNHMLLQISETLPREMQGILACCNPIPPLVRQHLNFLHQIILKAREQPIIKPAIEAELNRPTVNINDKKDLLNNPLYCPHDLSHQPDLRDDLPTLLGSNKLVENFDDVQVEEVKLNVFEKIINGYRKDNTVDLKIISPYQRYKLMIPFMEEQKKRDMQIEEEKKRKALEEKRKQLPELQIVKIEDVLSQPTLRDLKKRPAEDTDATQNSSKKWKKDFKGLKADIPKFTASSEESPHSSNDTTPKRGNNKRGKIQKPSEFRQSSSKPVNFDYSNVDYGRLRTGAQPDNKKDRSSNQKFKGGKQTKAFNNMFNFSNFRLNKRK